MPRKKKLAQLPTFKTQHMGIYCIIINNYIYIGESFDLTRRWNQHLEDLQNNTHHNKLLQEQFNIDHSNIQFIPLFHVAYNYMRFVYVKYLHLDNDEDIVNLLKITLLCLEHKIINSYQKDSKYIVTNTENTLLKIYKLLNYNEKQYLKQCYNIIKNDYDNNHNIDKNSYIINLIKMSNDIIYDLSHIDIFNITDVQLHINY